MQASVPHHVAPSIAEEGCPLEASVILNNTGVKLLEEKRYSKAAETLRDSLHLMKCAMKQRQSPPRATMDTEDLTISHTSNTPVSSSRPVPLTDTTKLIEYDGVTSCSSETKRRSDDPTGRQSSATLTLTSPVSLPSSSNAHPVRIIRFSKSSKSVVEVEFLTSIILFNYALARSCLGSNMAEQDKRKEEATSLRLFEMAWTLLSDLNSIPRDLHAALPVLVMAKVILHQIIALRKEGYGRNGRNNNTSNNSQSSNLQGVEGDNAMGYYQQLLHSTCHTLVMAQRARDIENAAAPAAAEAA